jgi:Cell division protein
MKKILSNTGYFFKEVFLIIRLSLMSSILSLFSMGLIFFVLASVFSGWWISREVTDAIRGQVEISVYFNDGIDNEGALKLVGNIKKIQGVRDSRLVGEKEAYEGMVKILGKEADILKVFDKNPFTSYIEVNINVDYATPILKDLDKMDGIEYIRDNMDVLDRIESITHLLILVGYFVLAAAGITTLVIISHIIRLAIQNNREQINTLRLLGAPRLFIAFPFLLQGLLLTLVGGLLASFLAAYALKLVYAQMAGPLPFIPLPPIDTIIPGMTAMVMAVSAALGILGSLLGLATSRAR